MYYVYILYSRKDNKCPRLDTGCTNDLKRRFREHNSGIVKSTKNRIPFKLIHYEAFSNKTDAFAREKWLKSGYGRTHIKKYSRKY